MPKLRCVNLDWLEVCVLEPTNSRDGMTNDYARNAAYFEKQGYTVDIRAYGTPMYREMFTVCNGTKPLVEVRRDPYSAKSSGGIFPDNMCHLRLPNPRLYEGHPVEFLSSFIKCHRYEYKSTTRLDICNDFNTFDNNRDVMKFIRAYMREQYFKMNQKFVHVHGVDSWPFRDYWSLKWGDETSAVTTKLYEKSKELSDQGGKKPYIIDAWRDAGLCTELPVYRVEFSIKGSLLKNMVQRKTGQLLDLNYYEFPNRDTLLFTFMALADRYFDFREATNNRNGNPQRRDRCPRVNLFYATHDEKGYTPIRFVEKPDPMRTDKMLVKRLLSIIEDDAHWTSAEREMARTIAAKMMMFANYKRKGIEMPDVRLELELQISRPVMSEKQHREFLDKMEKHYMILREQREEILERLRNPYTIRDKDMPF